MKQLIFILFLPFLTIAQNDQDEYLLSMHEMEKGSIQYLFGDKVVLRSEASRESRALDTLKIGSAIKIIEKSDRYSSLFGMEWPWYKVKAGKKTGFVLAGLISFNNEKCEDGIYLVNMRRTEEKAFARYHYLKNDRVLYEGETELDTWLFTTDVSENRGVQNLNNILYISFYAEACGVNGGGVYIFNDENGLHEAFRPVRVVDGGSFWYKEELIFPQEEGGWQDYIVYRRESGETMDDEMNWTEIQTTLFNLQWKEGQLFPEIPEMRNCE